MHFHWFKQTMVGGSKNNNNMVLILIHVFVLSSLCMEVVNSVDWNFPAVFNLGDSNSDTGELTVGLGFQLAPPNGQNFFKTPSGRACDGRLIVDFLSKVLYFFTYYICSRLSLYSLDRDQTENTINC